MRLEGCLPGEPGRPRDDILDIERPKLPSIAAWYARLQEREPFRTHVMIPLS